MDNFALLNLDIAWTYLCLRSISHLNDVEKRLNFCEQSFKKTYGVNLERLIVLKGTIGNYITLFIIIINIMAYNRSKSRSTLISLKPYLFNIYIILIFLRENPHLIKIWKNLII